MSFTNYAWLNRLPDYDDTEFGYARSELQTAESTFKPDMPDDILLRLYSFLVDREQDQIWDVLRHLAEGLIYLRMYGPQCCPDEYKGGFDPEDHARAMEAVLAGTLPNKDLMSVYFQAENHSAAFVPHLRESKFAEGWTPVFPLARDQILSRMAEGRAIILSTLPSSICLLQREIGPASDDVEAA